MSESLLNYFDSELDFISREAQLFAEMHPGAAKGLGLSKNSVDDPQITRLIESVALLNARLHKRLDDDYPEFTDSLLRLLFPHYLRPLPSFSMMEFIPDEDLNATQEIPAGTHFDAVTAEGQRIVMRTCCDTQVHPMKLSRVTGRLAPFDDNPHFSHLDGKAMIALEFETLDPSIPLSEITVPLLEFHLRGEGQSAERLYDKLLGGVREILVHDYNEYFRLDKELLQPAGFSDLQQVLPYTPRSFHGFKLMTEFFMYHDRYHSFTINFDQVKDKFESSRAEVCIILDSLDVDLARSLSTEQIHLYTTPVVNLQSIIAEPLRASFNQPKYPVVLDASVPDELELFTIDRVVDRTEHKAHDVPELFNEKYHDNRPGLRWSLSQNVGANGTLNSALQIADLAHDSAEQSSRLLHLHTTCTNADHAVQLGPGTPMQCRESISLSCEARLLRRPTHRVLVQQCQEDAWPLLAHLCFNYHALFGSDSPLDTLKTMLSIYNFNNDPRNQAYIDSLKSIDNEQIVAPTRINEKSCFTYGSRITVVINPERLGGYGVELIANLLDRFFACFSDANSFTQLIIMLDGTKTPYKTFPRRCGWKTML
ncbi:Uncharacterised protein [BD1-7 clade bacterium]|uniref:Type VI secretion system protein ImpG n=1 Tax=BD1-7 clade bacterium TaxID=2029982 RepID=A0A5S9QAG0_9GAMM|nr:Uncharacterised protein [BD1-7 clade bacterium]CAA0115052.1 Uncharacterised protein [BD1-7 clade bacterium]